VAVSYHATNIQVLNANALEGLGQVRRRLMRRIFADIGDPSVQPSQLVLGLAPVG
jgi:hypothetical protein